MKKTILFAILSVSSFCVRAQNSFAQEQNIIEIKQLSEESYVNLLKTAPKNGWVYVKTDQGNVLINLSNDDYTARFNLNCANGNPPSFMIEYSDTYADGDYGGIDFTSSESDDHVALNFEINGKTYKNPFAPSEAKDFNVFKADLMKAETFTLVCYQLEYNSETDQDEIKFNRRIEFKNAYSNLLNEPVRCD